MLAPAPLTPPAAPDRGCYRMFLPSMAFPTGYRPSLRAHADLLDRLIGGHPVLHVKTRESLYVSAGSPKRYGNLMTHVRLEDLTWRFEPGDERYTADLADLVQLRFSLDRERAMAWDLAVILLQRAYTRDLATVETLVAAGDTMRAAATRASASPSRAARDATNDAREAFVETLRSATERGAA